MKHKMITIAVIVALCSAVVGTASAQPTKPNAPPAPHAPNNNANDVYVALSSGSRLWEGTQWSNYFCTEQEICKVGDVTGDGRSDVIAFVRTNNAPNDSDVYVAQSNGTSFGSPRKWSDYFCTLAEICAVGDVNGDGRDDAIAFVRTNNAPNDSDVYVALSDGASFGAPQKWSDYFCTLQEICAVGDVNGDGKADVVAFVRTNNAPNDSDMYVALSNGASFGAPQKWSDYFCTLQEVCAVADVNGDGKADAIAFVRTNNAPNDSDVYVALSNGASFGAPQKWSDYFCTLAEVCALGDVNGDGKADAIAFVRTSGRGNDDDVYVALSNGLVFGQPQKWADYFCTRQEICGVGDFNGDGKDDAVAFVRIPDIQLVPPRTVDLSVSLYWPATTSDFRARYTAIFGYFADAVFEMSNGADRIGTITVYHNYDHRDTANVVWYPNEWPNSPVSGITMPGAHINMGDTFTFKTPLNALADTNLVATGYTLAHEFGHYYYGLYDEYQGATPCGLFGSTVSDPWACDIPVQNSVMNNQWQAARFNDYAWLNFSIAKNETKFNANYRVYGASGWEVLTRDPILDRYSGQQQNNPARPFYPELQAVAPVGNQDASIELPNSAARSALHVVWVDYPVNGAASRAATADSYEAQVVSLDGDAVLYPEAARLVASLAKNGDYIARATVSAIVTDPAAATLSLVFRDDGIAPDVEADDGLYSALLPYHQAGSYHIEVNFANDDNQAEYSYLAQHYTPDPNGESFNLQPSPVGENFNQNAGIDLMVSGVPDNPGSQGPTSITVDNHSYPGRIDAAGDRDSFTFTADQTSELVLRVTDLALGMQPHILVYQGDPATLIGEYSFTSSGAAYFFTKLNVVTGDQFLVEVEHLDSTAEDGLFDISVGPALPDSVETQSRQLFLPLLLR